MKTAKYAHIEKLLTQLLDSVDGEFTEIESSEVQEFIDAREYGLALETLVDIIIEENKVVEDSTKRLVSRLAEAMGLDGSEALKRI
jgi:hypothetical protein